MNIKSKALKNILDNDAENHKTTIRSRNRDTS